MTTPSPIITCSTGAVTRWPDVTAAERLGEWCPRIEADAFEVMLYEEWYPRLDAVMDGVRDLARPIVAVHAEKSIGPNLAADEETDRESALVDYAENCRFTREVGAGLLVLHLWGLPDGDARLDRQLDILPHLIDIAEEHDIALGVEAIPCTERTPLRNLRDVIARDDRVRIVLDTEFLAMHDEVTAALEADWLWEGDRVRHIHIKDFDGNATDADGNRRYLHPGEGDIPFKEVFAAIRDRGFSGPLALEASVMDKAGEVDLARLNASLARLRDLAAAAWS